jgi:hypothetical protein
MSDNGAEWSIFIGAIGIVVAFTVKQFYASGLYGSEGPPIARWKGQLLFAGIGAVFLAAGIVHFVIGH